MREVTSVQKLGTVRTGEGIGVGREGDVPTLLLCASVTIRELVDRIASTDAVSTEMVGEGLIAIEVVVAEVGRSNWRSTTLVPFAQLTKMLSTTFSDGRLKME